jgi:hypothetical protein
MVLLSFESCNVLIDRGRDERIRLDQVPGDVEADDALRGSRRCDDLGERGHQLVALVGLGTHLLTKNEHCFLQLVVTLNDVAVGLQSTR